MTLYDFLSGALALGFAVCALFFLRFWRRTREELFLAFALAFLLLGIGQTVLDLANIPTEERSSLYLLRLLAFLLILAAIYRKNHEARH
jgi:membrane-associated PAP2 superfamily phosphatase